MNDNNYIPALRFHWLTNSYDWIVSHLMPEKEFKNAVIHNANIQIDFRVLDFGIGTATLSIMAFLHQPKAIYIGIDIDNKVLEIANKKIINSKSNIEVVKYDGNKLSLIISSIDSSFKLTINFL